MPELGVPPGVVSAEAAIQIDGRDEPRLTAGLLSLLVEETTEGLFRCEARFSNWGSGSNGPDFLYFDRQTLDFGKELAVRLGAGDGEGEVFRGHISALEGHFTPQEPPSLVVLAEDRGQALRLTRRSRVFEEMSDADVFAQIAADHGLQAEIDVSGPVHALLAQVNQSDLAFLRARARWLDAELWLEGRTLHVQSRRGRLQAATADLTLVLGRGLIELEVCADTAHQHTSVMVSGWDVAAKSGIQAEATAGALGSELGSDESGADVTRAAFGERVDRLAHHAPLTSADAQGLADAAFRGQARRFVVGHGVARGDARLRVGAKVRLEGLGPLFNGDYYVSEVRHTFHREEDGGYLTHFAVERPGIGRR